MVNRVIMGIGESMLQRDGLTETVAPWEDGQRIDSGPGAFEWWYFDAHLDDGSTVVIVFMTKSLLDRRAPLTPGVQITLTRPDGSKLREFPFYPAAEFQAAQDRCDVRIGPHRVRGAPYRDNLYRHELHVEADGLCTDLVLTGQVPAWRPGAGKSYYAADLSRYFAWLPAIPFGTVTGTLVYDGQAHPVHGTGYHDHNWGNVDLYSVMSHWLWGRAQVGSFSTIFVEQVTTRRYGRQRLPVFLLAQGERILTGDGRPLRMEAADWQRHEGGRSYPTQVDFIWEADEGRVQLALRRPLLIEATSLLGALPDWKRRLLRRFVNPYYLRFQADLELHVDLEGVQAKERGPALYEMMLLH